MKRLLCVVISLVLVFGISTTAFAYTEPFSSSGTVEVSKRIYSSCYMEIPSTVDYDMQTTCNVDIYNIEMLDNEVIRVLASGLNQNNAIPLTKAGSNTTLEVNVKDGSGQLVTASNPYLAEIDKAHISSATKSAFFSFSFELRNPYEYQGAEPGIYTGTMQYQISIDEVDG